MVGCGENNIDIVKNYTFPNIKTMTIGTAIGTFDECQSVKWKDESNEAQKIVSATCVVKPEILKAEYETEIAKLQKEKDEYKAEFDKAKDEFEKRYKEAEQKALNSFKADRQRELDWAVTWGNWPKDTGTTEDDVWELYDEFCKDKKFCDNDGLSTKIQYKYKLGKNTNKEERMIKSINNLKKEMDKEFSPENYNMPKFIEPVKMFGRDLNQTIEPISSRSYKFEFFVNTDKTVEFKDEYIIENGLAEKSGGFGKGRILSKFYKR
ncbi:OmpH family outer membrane protein [Campylobacter corcagiensis]|uniref:OmpH family outer membrane protein n=1 Tax=Campylobacter corcagiensis TaxID=1448857 RepID=UPI00046E8B9F|nr:OmpH family outer membrane protein [Campylobacter corcagiensis]